MPRVSGRSSHLRTGTGFILLAILAGLVGAVLSLCLHVPSLMQGTHAGAWRAVALQHGPIMVAFAAIPALLGGFGTAVVPLQVGAPDTAFPRLAVLSLLLTAGGFATVLGGLLPGAPPFLPLGALYVSGLAILLYSANLVATMLNMRRPGMSLGAMPVFAWSQMIASLLALTAVPLLLAALTLLASRGTLPMSPVQHLFRFLGAPGDAIMILPGLGLASEIVSGLCGRPLAGRRLVLVSMALLAGVGVLDWANRLLSGAAGGGDAVSRAATILPVLAILGCWAVTLWRAPRASAMLRQVPGLFALGFMVLLLGIAVADLRASGSLHDGPALAAVFALFAGAYWWVGTVTGRTYPQALGRLQFWLLAAGAGLAMLPQATLAAAGDALTSLSVLVFALVVVLALLRGRSLPAASPSSADRDRLGSSRARPEAAR